MTKIDGGLSDEFRERLPGIHFQRIETGGTGRGIPDTNYAASVPYHSSHGFASEGHTLGVEGWVEFKQTDGWVVTLKPEQVGWLLRRARLGCRVWVAVRRRSAAGPRRGGAVDELWLVPGGLAAQAKDGGLRSLPRGQGAAQIWSGGPAAWDWTAVRELLLG